MLQKLLECIDERQMLIKQKENLSEKQIKEAMDTIIEKDIFSPNGESLVEAISAKVVQTDTTDYDLEL